MDVKIDFLNGSLEEKIYMDKLEGFSIKEKEYMVCKLQKSIYLNKFLDNSILSSMILLLRSSL